MSLGLLQPFVHASKGLTARLELGPRLRVPQQVGQRALTATQDSLREHGLRYAIAFQLAAYLVRQLFRVELFHLSIRRRWYRLLLLLFTTTTSSTICTTTTILIVIGGMLLFAAAAVLTTVRHYSVYHHDHVRLRC